MKTTTCLAAGFLWFALAPMSSWAQDTPATPPVTPSPTIDKTEDPITEVLLSLKELPADISDSELAAVTATVDGLREKMATTQRLIDVGVAPKGDLADAKTRLSVAENALEGAKMMFGSSQRTKKLASPVDVQLKDATVLQTAEALSRGSGVPIRVDASVPKKTRITLDARRVALSTVLEAIARQADLLIVPDGEGVTLQPRPSLSVNGTNEIHTIRNWPWSSEWGSLPPGAGGLGAFSMPFLTASTTLPKGSNMAENIFAMRGTPEPDGRVAVTSVQDHIVVAEAGANDKGEQGTWLTVYRLRGENLVESSSTFHKARSVSVRVKTTIKTTK